MAFSSLYTRHEPRYRGTRSFYRHVARGTARRRRLSCPHVCGSTTGPSSPRLPLPLGRSSPSARRTRPAQRTRPGHCPRRAPASFPTRVLGPLVRISTRYGVRFRFRTVVVYTLDPRGGGFCGHRSSSRVRPGAAAVEHGTRVKRRRRGPRNVRVVASPVAPDAFHRTRSLGWRSGRVPPRGVDAVSSARKTVLSNAVATTRRRRRLLENRTSRFPAVACAGALLRPFRTPAASGAVCFFSRPTCRAQNDRRLRRLLRRFVYDGGSLFPHMHLPSSLPRQDEYVFIVN